MIKKVGIIDYGAGNLKSITKALNIFKLDSRIIKIFSRNVNSQLSNCDLIVLPGVGEFGSSMQGLKIIKDEIIKHIKNKKPLLGICLGMQVLFNKSEESYGVKGLDIISGEVVKFKFNRNNYLKIPHMCWNKVKFVEIDRKKDKRAIILGNISNEEFFYFVHSYYVVPKEKGVIFGTTVYGKKFCSMIVKDNIVATQFHLEKSGSMGLCLLGNIVKYFESL